MNQGNGSVTAAYGDGVKVKKGLGTEDAQKEMERHKPAIMKALGGASMGNVEDSVRTEKALVMSTKAGQDVVIKGAEYVNMFDRMISSEEKAKEKQD